MRREPVRLGRTKTSQSWSDPEWRRKGRREGGKFEALVQVQGKFGKAQSPLPPRNLLPWYPCHVQSLVGNCSLAALVMDFWAQLLELPVEHTPCIQRSEKCLLVAVHTGGPPLPWTVQGGHYSQTTQVSIKISTEWTHFPTWLPCEATECSYFPSDTNVPSSAE